jgi:hypothetical protein
MPYLENRKSQEIARHARLNPRSRFTAPSPSSSPSLGPYAFLILEPNKVTNYITIEYALPFYALLLFARPFAGPLCLVGLFSSTIAFNGS